MTTLLFLDDYHVGDPLFLADLGRRLSTLGAAGRTVIVHRASEEVAKNLEGAEAGEHDQVVERTIRQTNQGITRRLIEEGVPAVSVQGSDRPLFTVDDLDEGSLSVGSTGWLIGMVEMGSVAVVSPLADSTVGARSVNPVDAALAVAEVLRTHGEVQCAVFCSSRKEGLFDGGQRLESVSVSDLGRFSDIIDVVAARSLEAVVDRLVATNSVALAKGSLLPGTRITAGA